METYKIFTRRVAYQLRKMGFKCIGVEPSWKNPMYDVYLFEKTDALLSALKTLKN